MAKKDLFQELEITQDTKFAFPGSVSFNAPDTDPDDVDPDGLDPDDADPDTQLDPDVDPDPDTDPDNPDTDPDPDAEDDFSYEPLFQDLVAEGILYDADGEEGYDDSPEGFRKAVLDSRDKEVTKYIETLPPTAQRIMQLALKGAEEEDIQSLLALEDGPDWENADLSDEDVQRAAVEEAMRLRDGDVTEEEIQEALDDLADLGKLQKQAEKDKKFLVKQQEVQKAEIEKQVAAREQATKQAYEQEVTQVKTYVEQVDAIAGYKLSKADREGFMQYLTVKGKDGKTQAEKMNTPERRIQKEFLNYKNFNVSTVERQATTEIVKNVKKQLARYPKQGGSSQPVRVEKEVEGLIGRILLPGRATN